MDKQGQQDSWHITKRPDDYRPLLISQPIPPHQPIMRTSRVHAVLFTKEACPPCAKTKEFAYDILESNLNLAETISFMKKENHSALVESYSLSLYPTLLVVGPNGLEMDRVVGGRAVQRILKDKLIEIYKENNA